MYQSKFKRTCMALYYGWGHAGELAKSNQHSRIWFYADMLHYFFKYGLGSQRYILYKFNQKKKEEKDAEAALYYKKVFEGRNDLDKYRKFIAKWSDLKYHTTRRKMTIRNKAYRKFYNMGRGSHVEYGVTIYYYHHHKGTFTVGENVYMARNSDLDITGDLTIEKNASISDGAKVLTHNHDLDHKFRSGGATDVKGLDTTKGCNPTPLRICDSAWIGTRAIIMPGTTEIGRFAIVAAGSIVEKRVPPYAVVKGNPAKIVGFRCSPEEAMQYEEANYPQEERIPYETLKANYEKYFNAERRKEIRQWLRY